VDVLADSSPLVILAKLDCFELLHRCYPRVYISPEVHNGVVLAAAGLSGAAEVANARWIEVKQLRNQADLLAAQEKYPLGLGEISTILLAKEIQAGEVLLDDYNARKLARDESFHVRGSVGLLEVFYVRGELTDLSAVLRALLVHSYIDRQLLDARSRSLNLAPLQAYDMQYHSVIAIHENSYWWRVLATPGCWSAGNSVPGG
jgi:predicted nucleic acid-binding protein